MIAGPSQDDVVARQPHHYILWLGTMGYIAPIDEERTAGGLTAGQDTEKG
jgi:hypothetical protein